MLVLISTLALISRTDNAAAQAFLFRIMLDITHERDASMEGASGLQQWWGDECHEGDDAGAHLCELP